MNRAYVPDNTRSSMAIVLSLAIAVTLIAVLVGLSDKPKVDTLAVTGLIVSDAPSSLAETAPANDFGFTAENLPIELDEAGDPILIDETTDDAADVDAAAIAAAALTEAAESALAAPTTLPAPTSVPEPTPEVAAAVEPTPVPSVLPTPDPTALPLSSSDPAALSSGTVQGAFFTGGPESEGANVIENQIEVSFNTDGSGTFDGVLDITYADQSRVYLEMSGDLVWTTGNPQVEAVVIGTFGFDAVDEADSMRQDQGDLSITSLQSGSGSLCASRCFGFTFPPQL
jgi:hypothetical protein